MKKYDAPCAGCGEILRGGPKSLPAGVRMCHDCRRTRREARQSPWPAERDCSVCGSPYMATCAKAKYCSRKCKLSHGPGGAPSRLLETIRATAPKAEATERACIICRAVFTTKGCRRRCAGCQRAGVTARNVCRACGVFIAHHRQYCSAPTCRTRRIPCVRCSLEFEVPVRSRSEQRCSECRRELALAHWRRKNAVRRGAKPVGRRMTIGELGTRDGWRCHLCTKKVDPSLRAPHPMSATFDHLIPVSDDGDDSPENLALAHWRCNSSRGAGGVVQLLLVG